MSKEKVKGVADIVFLVDATGSMEPCIDALKENIEGFIQLLTVVDANNSSPIKDWRGRVIGYRDYADNADDWFEDNPFVRDVESLKRQLSSLQAKGGGDEPESLLDSLFKVATWGQMERGTQTESATQWRHRSRAARVVIVFTDASYHETMSIPEAAGGTFVDVANHVHANRIILSVFAPMHALYEKLSTLDKSEVMFINEDGGEPTAAMKTFTADKNNFKEVLKQLAASVSKSAEVAAESVDEL